ncbi:MAG: hypothetical protein WC884_01295 [Candidatus Paceibacterota bacterium]
MNNNIEIKRVIFNIMLSLLVGLALWYVFILGNMVFDIVQRRTLEKEALLISNEVADLELSYLSISKNVDLALSSSMGFKEIKATFAIRKSLGYNAISKDLDSLKFNNNEI